MTITTKTTRSILLGAAMLTTLMGLSVQPAFAASPATVTTVSAEVSNASPFVRRNKTLKGSVQVVQESGKTLLRVSDDFRASRGPDLKVFLSPERIENVTGKTATDGAVLLGFVKQNKGSHDYELPAGLDIAAFESVLVHCEAFSVLWGGANI